MHESLDLTILPSCGRSAPRKRLPGPRGRTPPRGKPSRGEVPAEELCSHCTAKCCRYFALPLDAPTDRGDFDQIRWFLLHEGASVFVEEDDWFLMVNSKCQHLGDDNRCTAYETRPQVCRDYTTEKCEYEDDWVYQQYFETAAQVAEYAEAVLGPERGRGIRSPKP